MRAEPRAKIMLCLISGARGRPARGGFLRRRRPRWWLPERSKRTYGRPTTRSWWRSTSPVARFCERMARKTTSILSPLRFVGSVTPSSPTITRPISTSRSPCRTFGSPHWPARARCASSHAGLSIRSGRHPLDGPSIGQTDSSGRRTTRSIDLLSHSCLTESGVVTIGRPSQPRLSMKSGRALPAASGCAMVWKGRPSNDSHRRGAINPDLQPGLYLVSAPT